VVLQDGKIAEQGTHQELVSNNNGVYSKLWAHQSGGFLKD
jgi:ATP-binding cassette subfamily B multidrug efflux pump